MAAWLWRIQREQIKCAPGSEVLKYIANQEAHHRQSTFKEEFPEFLRSHEIDYEERYVFDYVARIRGLVLCNTMITHSWRCGLLVYRRLRRLVTICDLLER
jgi:hypothetical protein